MATLDRQMNRAIAEADQLIAEVDEEIDGWRQIKGRAEAFGGPHRFAGAALVEEADIAIGELEDLRGKLQVLE